MKKRRRRSGSLGHRRPRCRVTANLRSAARRGRDCSGACVRRGGPPHAMWLRPSYPPAGRDFEDAVLLAPLLEVPIDLWCRRLW